MPDQYHRTVTLEARAQNIHFSIFSDLTTAGVIFYGESHTLTHKHTHISHTLTYTSDDVSVSYRWYQLECPLWEKEQEPAHLDQNLWSPVLHWPDKRHTDLRFYQHAKRRAQKRCRV